MNKIRTAKLVRDARYVAKRYAIEARNAANDLERAADQVTNWLNQDNAALHPGINPLGVLQGQALNIELLGAKLLQLSNIIGELE